MGKLCGLVGAEVGQMEKLELARSGPGDFFAPHHDGARREVSQLLWLQPCSDGGETAFPAFGLRFAPCAGAVLAWRNARSTTASTDHEKSEPNMQLLHEGCKVLVGEKIVASGWIHRGQVRPVKKGRRRRRGCPPQQSSSESLVSE